MSRRTKLTNSYIAMKTIINSFKIAISLAACLSVFATVHGAEITNAVTDVSKAEDLGLDFYNGKAYKITTVVSVTPTHVQVRYDGNFGGRKIPRIDLPPQLEAKYPYDSEKAAEYVARQSAIAIQQAAAQQAALQETYRRREQAVDAEIEKLVNQDVRLQSEVNLLEHSRAGNGRKVRMLHLMDQQRAIREKISKLRQQQIAMR
jgi:hypothetical protein